MEITKEQCLGNAEVVSRFYGAMPTGVAISKEGRIFVCFPRWGDMVDSSVVEIFGDCLVPYPNALMNVYDNSHPESTFISVQSVFVDSKNILWILDTAAPEFHEPDLLGAKLVAVDLRTNAVIRTYTFTSKVVYPTTYLNDVRIDYSKEDGYAYITDSSTTGTGAIIVLNLQTGEAFRRLQGSPSTSADPNFLPKVEGQFMMNRSASDTSKVTLAVDGIALSPDDSTLYFCPLSSRYLYSIDTNLLVDTRISNRRLEQHVQFLFEKGASDGMICDTNGNLYFGDYENNSICVLTTDGEVKTLLHSPYILWPDTFAIYQDDLYFTVNQLHRQKQYHCGIDLREQPYCIFRIPLYR